MGNRLEEASTPRGRRVSTFRGRQEGETRSSPPRGSPAQDSLMTGMANTLGLDSDHIARQVGFDEFTSMVTKCRGCAKPDACILWMVDHSTGANAAPDFCLNGEQLEKLKLQT